MSKVMFQVRKSNIKFKRNDLQPGQALITDYKSFKLTEQRWRDAKNRIEFKYKLATCKGTNKGTLFTLLNSEFCDPNNSKKERTKERTENGQGTDKERATQVNDIHYKEEEQEEEQQPEQTVVGEFEESIIVAIEEGYKYIKEIFQNVQECMLCCVDPPLSAEETIKSIEILKLSDDDLKRLYHKHKFQVDHIMRAIRWTDENKSKIHTSFMGTIIAQCKDAKLGKFWDSEKRKISPKDLVKSLFKNGERFGPNAGWVEIYYDEKGVTFTQWNGKTKPLQYNLDGFEEKLYAMIDHYKIPIQKIA